MDEEAEEERLFINSPTDSGVRGDGCEDGGQSSSEIVANIGFNCDWCDWCDWLHESIHLYLLSLQRECISVKM